jgi:hypothetical protein
VIPRVQSALNKFKPNHGDAVMTQKDELLPLRIMPKVIEAATFNLARLALLRVANPLRVSLTDHRCLDIILDQQQWLCVDGCSEDQPILAWREFDMRHRDALHQPINCKLHLYHVHAGLVMGTARDSLVQVLTDLLHEHTDKKTKEP